MDSVKNDEPRKNIPVICNSSRSEEGKGNKKPQGIHLNPKFFHKSPQDHRPFYPSTDFPPQPPLGHENNQRFRFQNPARYHRDHPPQRFPSFPRFRPPPFQEPQYPPPFPPNTNHLNWQGGAGIPNFQNFPVGPGPGHAGPPPPPRFQNNFAPNYGGNHFNYHHHQPQPPEFHYENQFPPPSDFGRPNMEPTPAPPYYESFHDEDRRPYGHERQEGRQRRKSRSRSRSLESRRRRSTSESSASYSTESRQSRQSRSLSSESHLRERTHSSSSKNNNRDKETIWDSDNERNSDSDLDLSKPLDSLTSNVADSESLLRDALKCLGSSKVQTMIPLELSQVNRTELFQMCRELLDETENDQIIKVMEGRVDIRGEPCSSRSIHSQQDSPVKKGPTSSVESDKDSASVRRKTVKKKKSKKKHKKRKKHHAPLQETETESEEESQEYESVDDSSSKSIVKSSTLTPDADSSKSSSGGATTAQQSLLELIQIEYKTKAINVMLKNLGVATEISSIVSDAIRTNGVTVVQGHLSTQEEAETNCQNLSTEKIYVADADSENGEFEEEQEQKILPDEPTNKLHDSAVINESESGSPTKNSRNQNANSNTDNSPHENVRKVECAKAQDQVDSSEAKAIDAVPSVTLDEKELLKSVVEDVLDLDVGANEEIDFL